MGQRMKTHKSQNEAKESKPTTTDNQNEPSEEQTEAVGTRARYIAKVSIAM